MYDEEFTHYGHSYNHHGSVKYYSPNELSRICRQSIDSDSITENPHYKRMKRDDKKHHRKRHRHKNEIKEPYYELAMKQKKEKPKHKNEHTERKPTYEQFYSMTHQHKDRRKHKKRIKQDADGFSELNHQDLQRLMNDCNRDIDRHSNFSIGYYELRRDLNCRSIDQIPTRDVSSVDKISKISESLKIEQRRDTETKKCEQVPSQHFSVLTESCHLNDAEVGRFGSPRKELNNGHKLSRNKRRSKRENEYVSNCVSDHLMSDSNKYNYPEWIRGDSIQQRGQHREILEEDYQQKFHSFDKNRNTQRVCIQQSKHNNYGELRSSHFARVRDESERDLTTEFMKGKAKGDKVENRDQNYKLMKKYMRKLAKERESQGFYSRARKYKFELKEGTENEEKRNDYKNTHLHYSELKTNGDKDKKMKRSKKYPNNSQLLNLDDKESEPTKIYNKKQKHKKHKSRKESSGIKATNKSRLENLSLDRAAKKRESNKKRSRNNNSYAISDHGLKTKYKSESSLSTVHRKNRDLICLFKSREPFEETLQCESIFSNEKYGDVPSPSHRLQNQKHRRVNYCDEREFFIYDNDRSIFPVEEHTLNDAHSMQRRVELFQTVMNKDLSNSPRSSLSRSRHIISSTINAKLNTTINTDDLKNSEIPNKEVHHLDVGTSNIVDSNFVDALDILTEVPICSKEVRSVLNVNDQHSIGKTDVMVSTYGIIVKGIEPSKNIDTTKKNELSYCTEKQKKNNLKCKILSVVAITPENFGNKTEDRNGSIMKTMSISQLTHNDATSLVRNPFSDKRLERLLKYYGVEPHPEIEGGYSVEGFSNDKSSKDSKLLKKLIISKLADYFKKIEEENSGEIIDFRTDNSKVVKLVLPMDCLSLECSYDINFSEVERVDNTAKQSLSDLYINYADVDDLNSDNRQKQLYMKIHTGRTNDNKGENIVISGDSAVENAVYLKNHTDLFFFNAPTSLTKPTTHKTRTLYNEGNAEIPMFEKKLLNDTSPTQNGKYTSMEPLDIEKASTFVVSENDLSSAHMNCLSNFQTSPRDSKGKKSLQEADIYNKQTTLQFSETNLSNWNNFNYQEFGKSKKQNPCDISHPEIKTFVTVKTKPQRVEFSDYFLSQNSTIETDLLPNNEEHIISSTEQKHKKSLEIQAEIQEFSEKAVDFCLGLRRYEVDGKDAAMKEEDYRKSGIYPIKNKGLFTTCNPECSIDALFTEKLKQNSVISQMMNSSSQNERTFIQNENDKTLGGITHNEYIINDISGENYEKKYVSPPNLINGFIVSSPRATATLNNEPKAFLCEKNERSEIFSDKTKLINEMKYSTNSRKSDHNEPYEELYSATKTWERGGKHKFESENRVLSHQVSGEKKLDNSVQKCLNWNLRNSSQTVVNEFPDSDQNKVSGMDKSTQKSSYAPRRSCIPIAKKEITKCPSGQMRSSSVSPDNNTSLLLTKSYRIPLGQSSYEKRKLYDTTIRNNVKRRSLSESSETTNKIPLVYEVRYFNIHNEYLVPLENQSFQNNMITNGDKGCYSDNLNKDNFQMRSCKNSSASPSSILEKSDYNFNNIKANDSEENTSEKLVDSHHNLHVGASNNEFYQENHNEHSLSPKISVKCVHESRKIKKKTQIEDFCYNLDSSKPKSCNHRSRIAVKCSRRTFSNEAKNLTLQKKEMVNKNGEYSDDSMNCIDESQTFQKLTDLSIDKVDDVELFLFFDNQNLSLLTTQFSENFGEKSVASSSAEGESSDSSDGNIASNDSTLINGQVHSNSSSTESRETIKAVETPEIIEDSVIDSGYLTKGAEANYSRTTLDSGRKIGKLKSSLKKSDIKICELVKSKSSNSKWGQRDLLRLKIQLLFPNVYDDFELIEEAENTELIKFYIESSNEKLKGAVETISRKKDMSVKSRSVISLPSVKIIPNENGLLKSSGDISSDCSSLMNKGGFYNYQKFIAQNNDQYSSDILSKIKFSEDYRSGRETPEDEYPRSETSSMKSSSVYSVKSQSSTRKSIIELFKWKSSKNVMSSSEVNLAPENQLEDPEKSNISEEQFCNHFHQIMALECQKFAKKVKNQSLVKENEEEMEEFREIPLEFILKNRNASVHSPIEYIKPKSLFSSTKTDNIEQNVVINEFETPTRDNWPDKVKLVTNNHITTEKNCVINELQKISKNKSLSTNSSKLNLYFPIKEKKSALEFIERFQICSSLGKFSNIPSRKHISEIMPLNSLTKHHGKEFFDNLLSLYDHESQFIMKLIRDDEFFISLIEKIRNDEGTINIIYHKEMKRRCKKEKKQGILARLFKRKKKSNETLLISPSIGKSLEFAKSLSAESTSVRRESCYSFYRDIKDFEKGKEKRPPTMANSEMLQGLAHKAKAHLEPMVKATFPNQNTNDRIKLAGFLKFLEMIEKGDIAFLNNGEHKFIIEAKLRKHVAELFDKVYRIANREVLQRNIILDDKKIELLKLLVTKYHIGIDIHINILAIYIGRSLIQSKSQLEDAILCLMRLNTEEVNLEEFERNCGIHHVQ